MERGLLLPPEHRRPEPLKVRINVPEIYEKCFYPPATPNVIDFEVIGSCTYGCEWCYGPEHAMTGRLDAQSYTEMAHAFMHFGTRRFVITGGEPLLRPDIQDIIKGIPNAAHMADGRTQPISLTLSTSGDGLLDRHPYILNLLAQRESAEIGLPIDAPNQFLNEKMRPAVSRAKQGKNFGQVIDILRVLQEKGEFKDIGVKLRTVVTSKNMRDISAIPDALIEYGIDISRIAWKLYQVNNYVGPRLGDIARGSWQISDWRFGQVTDRIQRRYGHLFGAVRPQFAKEAAERYTFVGPTADVRVVKLSTLGEPEDIDLGNIAQEPRQVLEDLSYIGNAPLHNLSEEHRRYLGFMAARLEP